MWLELKVQCYCSQHHKQFVAMTSYNKNIHQNFNLTKSDEIGIKLELSHLSTKCTNKTL